MTDRSQTNLNSQITFHGSWIQAPEFDYGKADADYYKKNPNPIFKRKFAVSVNKASRVKLNIAALGYYIVNINGTRVKNYELNNDWTDYKKRIYFDTFDITNYLQNGINEIQVELGNGMYNPSPLRLFGKYNLRERLSTIGEPRVILDVLDNGKVLLCSDGNWEVKQSKLITNNLYLGETLNNHTENSDYGEPITLPQTEEEKRNFYPSIIPKVKKQKSINAKVK